MARKKQSDMVVPYLIGFWQSVTLYEYGPHGDCTDSPNSNDGQRNLEMIERVPPLVPALGEGYKSNTTKEDGFLNEFGVNSEGYIQPTTCI